MGKLKHFKGQDKWYRRFWCWGSVFSWKLKRSKVILPKYRKANTIEHFNIRKLS